MTRGAAVMLTAALAFAPGSRADGMNQPTSAWRNPADGMEFVWIPPGSFQAECPAEAPDGKPELRRVTFTQGFWMGRTEVTVDQFRRFVRRTGCVTDAETATNRWTWRRPGFKQRGNQPAVWLSSGDALEYARWAGVDLPTDAEWLHACRAGTTNRYYWGDELDDRYVWHRANSVEGPQPVGRKRPNPWGLFDTVGNAKEYCRADDGCFVPMGSAWTRCPEYRTRQGFVATHLIAEGVEPRLHRCDPSPEFAPYPWDDDRGFRCIWRLGPGRAPGGQVPHPPGSTNLLARERL